jgi:hypothetical protein
VGSEVVFAAGHYTPATGEGRELLAHELAHVVQQRGGEGGVPAAHAPALEDAADRAAVRVAAGLHAQVDPAPAQVRAGAAAGAGAAAAQLKPEERKWKGTYVDEAALVKFIAKQKNISEVEAKKQLPPILAKIKQQGAAVVAAYPGFKDQKFDYDMLQDIVVGPDRKLPNCFGDVCKGAKERWEPGKADLDAWLKQEGYAVAKTCGCECGSKKVAVYEITLTYEDAGRSDSLVQPYHIAEEQEDCTWRSRLGDLGVIIHDRAEQLVSQAAAEFLAKEWATAGGVTFKGSKLAMICYAKKHSRADYHASPGGPLTCAAAPKKEEKKKK